MMFWYGDHGMGVGWAIVSTLIMLAVWGGVLALIVYAVRGAFYREGPNRYREGPNRPLSNAGQILAERFARGEIDADEYRARLDVIGGK